MKKGNQEIDYVEAILAMRTMLSLNHTNVHKSEIRDFVCIEAINYNCIEQSFKKQT
jgi:hypothetical protein